MRESSHLLSEGTPKQPATDARLARWRLQREAQTLLPDERVAFCLRRLQASTVDVLYAPQQQAAHYGGLMVCGSVWMCPLCAAKISERRRLELEQAIACCIANGGAVYLATYTIAHKRYDTLEELLEAFLAARKRARQGRAAQRLRETFGIIGTVSVREVTWSEQNGWHPHCHELVFFSGEVDADAYAQAVSAQWQRSAEHEGLNMNEHGFQLARTYGAVADYVAKFGREPLRAPWGASAELTKAHMKHGRGEEHLTPFAMLELIALGHEELKPLFQEYARWFKGKHQLVWSAGLRSRLLERSEEQSDLEIAQVTEEEVVLLGQLNRQQWSIILRHEARGKLLEVARSGDWQLVMAFLVRLGADPELTSPLLGSPTNKVPQDLEEDYKSGNPTDNPAELIQEGEDERTKLYQDVVQVRYDVVNNHKVLPFIRKIKKRTEGKKPNSHFPSSSSQRSQHQEVLATEQLTIREDQAPVSSSVMGKGGERTKQR